MSKRPLDTDGCSSGDPRKHAKLYTEEELQAVLHRARSEAEASLCETFMVSDPVHGLMMLPEIAKRIVDTRLFQRMRHIKQLAMCQYVYPGATHNRFFHSIGTAYLAYEFVKGLRLRQPELNLSKRDVLCLMIAALCHDLGHPCYSHMFEVFMHGLGRRRRRAFEAQGRSTTDVEEAELRRYESWTHEAASIRLLEAVFVELQDILVDAGLGRDNGDGDDFAFIKELIEPPKERLQELLDQGQLYSRWGELMHGRPVEKAWLYEIVSNWRSGIDVDRFDYFRRDAHYLGIQRQYDHERYMKCAKVIPDTGGVPTIASPEKNKDSLCANMLELRKTLHLMAYHHKTIKKLEMHMVDILVLLDDHIRLTGAGGRRLKMSEAAMELDLVAYPKLTDTFIEAQLLTGVDDTAAPLAAAAAEYERRVIRRNLMRLVAIWDLPRVGEDYNARAGLMPLPPSEEVLGGLLRAYEQRGRDLQPEMPVREVKLDELRCQAASMHTGMGEKDAITRVHFYKKESSGQGILALADSDTKPLRRRVFVFWNPEQGADDSLTLKRLTHAFQGWAQEQVEWHEASVKAHSPVRAESPLRSTRVASMAPPARNASASRPKRGLRIQASCPPDPPPLAKH
mmetsp:Transcript_111093/g.313408  ORF Transcript_111093/g.313408 Transcript_111093/m.313408 type:complete len:624 (-) Transcript_111093:91-1962(-)